ncbi:MAG: ankyrin repeat domain-containing protein [Candidatus Cardinium sp.]|uniref:ankyrin repeat domain-containing protein n=1 Tax=Candidatus Cardinium sp. TP TaxID=2961955 RepID=UPI0021B02EE9|nr:ankyrin repeat domain-containing protein [Candidatus Cardinium sp. TP]MCT4697422.1 ankyrin repeat domain-containing protein [Candidatus Cardinium sp. TP]MDN5247311.1 ankyrin repeat domain-containing protein [Candidatus Cardinium sp.]
MRCLALAILTFSSLQASSCRSSEKESEQPDLITAIKKGDRKKVDSCLRQGADPNRPDVYGNLPLHWACFYDRKGPIIQILLDAGAAIDKKDKSGCIPLDWAHKQSNASAAKLLIQKAMDLNKLEMRGQDDKTLLHYAAALDDKENAKVVEQLLALSLDPNSKDTCGKVPFDYATNNEVVVQLYLVTSNPIASKL